MHTAVSDKTLITPSPLKRGDLIAILSPASVVKEEYIDGAARVISRAGFEPVIMPHAKGPSEGSYSASLSNRVGDMLQALTDNRIKAILCARGGYGAVHLLPAIRQSLIASGRKWIIGFSDISALHALWMKSGVRSLHAPMAKHLTESEEGNHITDRLFKILTGEKEWHDTVPTNSMSVHGSAQGILRGGNLAVLNGLAATPYDMLNAGDAADTVLFLEDIAEPIYKVERVLYRLHLSGFLDKVKGFIFGQFTEYKSSANYTTMEQMIKERLQEWNLDDRPIAFNFPVGHVDDNRVMAEGAECRLVVDTGCTSLYQRL